MALDLLKRAATKIITMATMAFALSTAACGGVSEDAAEPATQELARKPAGKAETATLSAEAKFEGWLEHVREKEGKAADLYYAYYDAETARPWFLSPMISAE